jgi:hypothetical protein
MKKLTLILPAVIALLSVAVVKTHAQAALNSVQTHIDEVDAIISKSHTGTSEAVNLKAKNNFTKDYPKASTAEWSFLDDKSWMCSFNMNDILYKAYYTANGQWLGAISSYDGSKLNKSIRNAVKSVYYNSDIVFVNQIDLARNKVVYIVEIQDEKSIRKVRVNPDENEMEVIQEFAKK